MKERYHHRIFYLLLSCIFLSVAPLWAEPDDRLSQKIHLPDGKETVYQLLSRITEQTGYLFIYDSQLIDNEQMIKIKRGEYTVAEALLIIIPDSTIRPHCIGKHILLQRTEESPDTLSLPKPVSLQSIPSYFTIEGVLQDRYTDEVIPFGSVGIREAAIGTITNQNGEFRLHVPDSLREAHLSFSHLGYQPQEFVCAGLERHFQQIRLEPKVIPIQEVIIRRVNPLQLIQNMLIKVEQNYSRKPVYHTTFYREGIERKKNFISLTEAVFRIYKTPYHTNASSDQVKLLKMRRISNQQEKDTMITKMKSGINACLMLDLMKHPADFLLPDGDQFYLYAHTDITVLDNRLANVISFEQKSQFNLPLYKGELYIDTENDALLRATFEINPQYIKKAAGMFVEKKSKHLRITPEKVFYTITYKPWNGVYYINHIRGDLHFKIKKSRQLFNTTSLHTWFEMVTCKTDTLQAIRFSRNETVPTRSVFSETHFTYDPSFWGDFNVILPEEKLNDAISKISLKIEETGN